MNVLLLSGAAKIGCQPILEVLHELEPQGVDFQVAMWAPPTQDLLAARPDMVVWGPKKVEEARPEHPITGSTDATDFSASTESEVEEQETQAEPTPLARPVGTNRLKAAVRWRLLRVRKAVRPYYGPARARVVRPVRRMRTATQPARAWRQVRGDDQVAHWAASADVIVAMDSQAVLAAWKLARRLPDVEVVYGLSAGRGLITRRLRP